MKKIFTLQMALYILVLFYSQVIYSQQLVQSFIEYNNLGNTYFAFSVSGAGDVNNDGYDDVIVGAEGGRAYIYYGGSSMNNTADVTMTGEGTINYFGHSVSGAGDVNNDGYDDVIVGAYYYNSQTGRAYIYFGSSSMDNTADVTMTGEGTSNEFGSSVSGAGDVNNDGYDDVIVGASRYNSYTGRAYIYYGGSNMDNTTDVTMTGEGTSNYFGHSVSDAGDVNNDGYDDVIVGAYYYSSQTGRVYIYYGGSSMDNTADVTMTGEGTSNEFGSSVSGAGDVNNDGYDDVIVGAYRYSSYTGRAYIYYGGSIMDNTADVTMSGGTNDRFGISVSFAGDVNNDEYGDVIVGAYGYAQRAYIYYGGSNMNNTADVIMNSEVISRFGYSVSGAIDLNNDGYDDVIVGAHYYYNYTGRAYIYYGGSSMNDTVDVIMTGETKDNYFGESVSGAGDVNNDGYDDVIVGAYYYYYQTGRAYIYYGGSSMDNTADVTMTGEGTSNYFGNSVSDAGDVNNDGYDDVIVGAKGVSNTGRAYIYYGGISMNNTADVVMTGEGTSSSFGGSVSGAGDVNNDGYDDLIIGAPYNDAGGENAGRAYVYFGGASMNNAVDVTMTGEGPDSRLGCSVSDAGDVNSDGYDDVIVGAYTYDAGALSDAGSAYIYFGGTSMNNAADVKITGDAFGDQLGYSVSGAGDVNNDGYDDVIVGAAYNDVGGSTAGCAYIYFGGGSMNNISDVIMNGEGTNNYFGYSVSGAGDVNNDGYDDVIVGAYGYDSYTGRVYIYYGGSSMNNIADVIMNGEGTKNYFGYSVSVAGDVNNDGYDDVIIGAYKYPYNGKAYIFTINIALQAAFTALIEGFYNGTSMVPDTVKVELRNSATPYSLVEEKKIVLDSSGQGNGLFTNALSAVPYYIVVKHRNSIETWSKLPQQFTGGLLNYDFTTDSAKAYGDNMKLKGSKWTMLSGDVNQDGSVDLADLTLVDNDSYNFVSGYVSTDINGDGNVGALDMNIVDNNSYNFVSSITPTTLAKPKKRLEVITTSEQK